MVNNITELVEKSDNVNPNILTYINHLNYFLTNKKIFHLNFGYLWYNGYLIWI